MLHRCLQHPYLYEESIEPRGLPQQETHEKLIDASAKLRFLKVLLPKLKSRGHRVLLFSQVHSRFSVCILLMSRSSSLHWILFKTSFKERVSLSSGLYVLHYLVYHMFAHCHFHIDRTVVRKGARDRRAWMNSIVLVQMCSYTS
jgi:hypothetical protein